MGLSKGVAMNTIYFSCHESFYHSRREAFTFGGLMKLFKCKVFPSRDARHADVVDRFNLLSDCDAYVLLPLGEGYKLGIDENQTWELRVWRAFHRPTYLVTPNYAVVRAEYIEKGGEVEIALSQQKALENTKP